MPFVCVTLVEAVGSTPQDAGAKMTHVAPETTSIIESKSISKDGGRAGYRGLLPPYIVLTELQGRFSEAGFLGQRYKPFATGGDPAAPRFVVEGVVAPSTGSGQ